MRGVRRIRRPELTEQRCPGACGRLIPITVFACPEDWNRLPGPVRARVATTFCPGTTALARIAIRNAAAEWLLDNPRVRPL